MVSNNNDSIEMSCRRHENTICASARNSFVIKPYMLTAFLTEDPLCLVTPCRPAVSFSSYLVTNEQLLQYRPEKRTGRRSLRHSSRSSLNGCLGKVTARAYFGARPVLGPQDSRSCPTQVRASSVLEKPLLLHSNY